MKELKDLAGRISEHLNEVYYEFSEGEGFLNACRYLWEKKKARLRLLFGADEREIDGRFRVYAVFSGNAEDTFHIPFLSLKAGELRYPSITPYIPSAHWYERELRDSFGIVPEGHPDPRPLVFHGMIPEGVYPLRRDLSMERLISTINPEALDRYQFMSVEGEGVYEIPVGPVHAGIIEPGHFRFSAVGETIYFLEPRLFYTHKGVEKQFESIGFYKGVELAERISGVSSFSHSTAYCMAIERMANLKVPEKALAIRTILLELERLYNHIGDIGNMCAGTGFAVGYAWGAELKEILMRLNHHITGSRYLRGVNIIGGVKVDIFDKADEIIYTLDNVMTQFRNYKDFLLKTVSHVERLENTGKLSKGLAESLGATGPVARASGINDDLRISHPFLLYHKVEFETHTRTGGDVFARMMVRADEVECSISIVNTLLEKPISSSLREEDIQIPPFVHGLGYVEGPRGSIFYWIKSDKNGNPMRVKVRSASYCNWPLMPFAVHGNIVPDFPLCNKSFNLSYSGSDM